LRQRRSGRPTGVLTLQPTIALPAGELVMDGEQKYLLKRRRATQ
jgi:hypothetical protein